MSCGRDCDFQVPPFLPPKYNTPTLRRMVPTTVPMDALIAISTTKLCSPCMEELLWADVALALVDAVIVTTSPAAPVEMVVATELVLGVADVKVDESTLRPLTEIPQMIMTTSSTALGVAESVLLLLSSFLLVR